MKKRIIIILICAVVLFAAGAFIGSAVSKKPTDNNIFKYRILHNASLSGTEIVEEAKKFHYDIVMFTPDQAKDAGHSALDTLKPGTLLAFERMSQNDAMVAIEFEDWQANDEAKERNYAYCLMTDKHGGLLKVILGDSTRLFDEGFYTTPIEVVARYLYEFDLGDDVASSIHPDMGSISFAEDTND